MKTFSPPLRGKDGFTLIETIVALMIFIIGGLSLAALLMQGVQAGRNSARATEAAAIAGQKIETFRNMPLSQIPGSETSRRPEDLNIFPPEALSGWDGEEEYQGFEPNRLYKLYWNIVPDFPLEGMASIRLEIQWEERGISKKIRFDFAKNHLF